ncbi:NAD(+)/NADH kinase [bacterium]|nr:NAD(+)/NADH kinase [bacterium]
MSEYRKKPIERIFVVYKRSVFQKYFLELKNYKISNLIHKRHPLTKGMIKTHHQHMNSLKVIKEVLNNSGIKYRMSTRSHSTNFKGFDLVITIGGDGTFLRATHYIKDQLILGINSVPTQSVGAHCSIHYDAFAEKLQEIISGKYKIRELPRMRIKINRKTLPIEPINDLLFTNYSPAATSRYIISHGTHMEEHKSSGIWISTAIGSSAAVHATGGHIQKISDKRLQYIVREPYVAPHDKPYKVIHGYFKGQEQLKIMSKMLKARIFLDGPTAYFNIDYGDAVTIARSQKVVRVVL